jgi:hypothetical protein
LRTALGSLDIIEKAQVFVWQGRRYCWYDDGWHGPGFYWCGYARRHGLGWGGGSGWHGWQQGVQPEGGKPEGRKPEGRKSQGAQPEGAKPEGRKPESAQPQGGKPEGGKPQGAQPQGGKSEGAQPQGGKQKVASRKVASRKVVSRRAASLRVARINRRIIHIGRRLERQETKTPRVVAWSAGSSIVVL